MRFRKSNWRITPPELTTADAVRDALQPDHMGAEWDKMAEMMARLLEELQAYNKMTATSVARVIGDVEAVS